MAVLVKLLATVFGFICIFAVWYVVSLVTTEFILSQLQSLSETTQSIGLGISLCLLFVGFLYSCFWGFCKIWKPLASNTHYQYLQSLKNSDPQ